VKSNRTKPADGDSCCIAIAEEAENRFESAAPHATYFSHGRIFLLFANPGFVDFKPSLRSTCELYSPWNLAGSNGRVDLRILFALQRLWPFEVWQNVLANQSRSWSGQLARGAAGFALRCSAAPRLF
jgi:hypothetical protein